MTDEPDPLTDDLEPLRDYELEEELARARRDGTLLPQKAAMILETVGMDDSFRAIMNPDLSQSAKEDVKKNLMAIAGLGKTATIQPGAGGPAFSITINIPEPASRPAPTAGGSGVSVTDARPVAETPPLLTASFKVKDADG